MKEHKIIKTEHGYIIDDVYALYPIKNAFNNNVSYWISKDGYTCARYCFSSNNAIPLETQLKHIDGYIQYFESTVVGSEKKDTLERLIDVVEEWISEVGYDIAIEGDDYNILARLFQINFGLKSI